GEEAILSQPGDIVGSPQYGLLDDTTEFRDTGKHIPRSTIGSNASVSTSPSAVHPSSVQVSTSVHRPMPVQEISTVPDEKVGVNLGATISTTSSGRSTPDSRKERRGTQQKATKTQRTPIMYSVTTSDKSDHFEEREEEEEKKKKKKKKEVDI
ncbi:hypothetical protein ADUPG1_007156, partial [Aduncisulcus paluster]